MVIFVILRGVVHSGKLTYQWKISTGFNGIYQEKNGGFFYGYVSFIGRVCVRHPQVACSFLDLAKAQQEASYSRTTYQGG